MHSAVSRLTFSLTTVALLAGGLAAAGPAAADTSPQRPTPKDAVVAGGYTALPPQRILDTRPSSALAPGTARTVPVAGQGGVPESGVAAVVVNLAVVTPKASGYLSAYPNPGKPTSSNLNFSAGRTIANLAVVPVASNGTIQLFNGSGGSAFVLVDVTGWFAPTTGTGPTTDDAFKPVGPTRILDTRGSAAIPAGGTARLVVRGQAGIPAAAGAAVLNVTAIGAGAAGYLTVYPGTAGRPTSSNLNFATGQTVAGLTAARLGTDGSVRIYNASARPLQVTADVAGWFRGTTSAVAGNFSFLTPARAFDTRGGLNTARAPLAPAEARVIPVTGRAGVPTSGVAAVVLNVTATDTTASGYLTVYSGANEPTSSTLNFNARQTVPNLVIVPLTSGSITVYNGSARSVSVLADVAGFVRSTNIDAPSTSTSRYVNDLLSSDTTGAITAKMFAHGQDDAVAINDSDDRTTLLEFGAQSNKVPNGAGLTEGVLPPNTQGNSQRLTYAQVVTAVKGYLDGFAAGRGESATGIVTVAVGTSNDGYLGATYRPADKGADWASEVVGPLVGYGSDRDVTVVGANDIEANFDGTAAEVKTWVSSYLGGNTLKLINNGAAPACPSTFGLIDTTCQPVASDHAGSPAQQWRQADYVAFSRGLGPTRISVLPQIYSDDDAVRWENMSLTSVSLGSGPLTFAGVLTQIGACGPTCSLSPSEAWAAMRQALDASTSTAGSKTPLPTVSDIDYDS